MGCGIRVTGALACVAGLAACAWGQTAPTNGWQLVWADEFEGTSLNTTKWTATNAPGNTNNELQYYSPQNVTVSGGELVLKAEQRSLGGRNYVSGLVKTSGKFAQQYGRFEGRMRLPKTQGIWPAFWMLPATGAWPPEIDIMELLGHQPNTVYMTNHWGVWPNNANWSTPFTGPDFSAGYHTFAVEWAPGRCDWFIDGVKRTTHNVNIPAEPFYMILNTAVGGDWPGNPNGSTVFPQYMRIDNVRVYRQNLVNATMEDWGPSGSTPLADWVGFGSRVADSSRKRSGAWCAKISAFGPNGNVDSGLYQEMAVRPGQVWRASSYWMNPTSTPLTGNNYARMDFEWYTSAGVLISVDTRTVLTVASPRDVYILGTLQAEAPAGAAKCRTVLKVLQIGVSGGSVYVDDADLQLVSTNGGFEDLGPAGNVGLYGWAKNGNASDSTLWPRTGVRGGKLFGRFTGSANTSSATQDFAARPGEVWTLGSYWYNSASDYMRGANTAGPVLEWRDSQLNLIRADAVTALNAASPRGEQIPARVVATAPAGTVWGRMVMNFSQPANESGAAFFDDVTLTRLLQNSSMDDFGPGGDGAFYGWSTFGNTFVESLFPRTGGSGGKVYGNFTGGYNTSGVFQDVPARPGQRWRARGYWYNATADFMRGANATFTNIEWRDAAGNLISFESAPGLDASSPRDVHIAAEVAGIAPAGAATARVVMLFTQPGVDTGAGFFDDVTLDLESGCVADVDGSGGVDLGDFFAFLNEFDAEGEAADVDGSGAVDLGDFFAFLNWFDSGC